MTKAIGTREEVMLGLAHHTSGGLHKSDFKYDPNYREKHSTKYVSKKVSAQAKKLNNLNGYLATPLTRLASDAQRKQYSSQKDLLSEAKKPLPSIPKRKTWVEFVKQVQVKNNIPFSEAMIKASAEWPKIGKK
jgi:hypothetical protein